MCVHAGAFAPGAQRGTEGDLGPGSLGKSTRVNFRENI